MPCLADTPTDVVVFLLDDARFDAGDVLTETTARLGSETVNFTRAYATSPLCCPSRASLLSGGWSPQQTTVIANQAPDGGATRFLDADTLAVRLQAAGYQTALIGKYLNEDTALGAYVPPGWTLWAANDEADSWNHFDVDLGSSTPTASSSATSTHVDQYVTDWQADEAVSFVRAHPDDPKFLLVSFLAPHHPHTPDAADTGEFLDFLYRDRAYEEADVSDKPAWIASLPLFTADEQAEADTANQQRLQTLLSVDRAMAAVIDAVSATSRGGTTLFVVSSDNGQLWGEHRLVGKGVAYEESTRVPLWLAHPDLSARDDASLVAMNLDLPATITALAGLAPTGEGSSLQSLACGEASGGRDAVLLQGWPGDVPIWSAVVTSRWKYIESAGDLSELYDLDADPYEEENVCAEAGNADTVAAFSAELAAGRGLAITSETLDPGAVGATVSLALSAWGGDAPLSWALTDGALPAGVSLSGDGLLSGVPEEAGTYTFRVAVTDSGISPYTGGPQSDSRGYTWVIADATVGTKVAGCGCASTEAPVGRGAAALLVMALLGCYFRRGGSVVTILLVLSLFGSAPAFADDAPAPAAVAGGATPAPDPLAGLDPKTVAHARELLELTGAKQMAMQMLDQMMPQMLRMAPNLPAGFWETVRARIDTEGLVDLIIPIYARHFSDKDLKGLIKFYKSPLGKRFLAAQPQLMTEGMAAGQQWGQQLVTGIIAPMIQTQLSSQPPQTP